MDSGSILDSLSEAIAAFNTQLTGALARADTYLFDTLSVDLNTVLSTALVGLIPVIMVVAWFSRPRIPAHEKRFLQDLYRTTGGSKWNRNHGWQSLDNWWWDPSVCYGLIYEDGHIVEIDLYKNNLAGLIPRSVGNMSKLEALRLGGNLLSGTIPSEIGLCQKLYILHLPYNKLEGALPNTIGRCRRLEKLILSGNHLSGALPPSFSQLTRLRSVVAFGNAISGPLPELRHFRSLYNFIANNNRLSGPIPPSISQCRALENFDVGANCLSGPVPESICDCRSLLTLYLYSNALEGELPARFCELKNLEYVDASANRLVGPLPADMGRLRKLRYFYAKDNALSGDLPGSLADLSALQVLNLKNNKLTGSVPEGILKLEKLKYFDVGNNLIMGDVPIPRAQAARGGGAGSMEGKKSRSDTRHGTMTLEAAGDERRSTVRMRISTHRLSKSRNNSRDGLHSEPASPLNSPGHLDMMGDSHCTSPISSKRVLKRTPSTKDDDIVMRQVYKEE